MAPVKKAAEKSSTKRTSSKSFKVNFHRPGFPPETVTVKSGTSVGEFVEQYNLGSYAVSHNGNTANMKDTLSKGDTIRVGVITKNG